MHIRKLNQYYLSSFIHNWKERNVGHIRVEQSYKLFWSNCDSYVPIKKSAEVDISYKYICPTLIFMTNVFNIYYT